MAYADKRGVTFSPVSIGGALIINGTMLAALIALNPEVIPPILGGPIEIINIPTPPPAQPITEKKQAEKEQPRETVRQDFTPPIAPVNIVEIKTGLTIPPTTGETFGTGPSTIIEPITPPRPPIEIGARLNPRYAGDLQPGYPQGMLRLNIEGKVTVSVLVGTDGRVKDVKAIAFSQEEFLKATREQAMRKWRFTPATRDGTPIESWREMSVRFEMPDA